METTSMKLLSRSKVIAPLIMDYMLSAGAQVNAEGAFLFPIGPTKLTEEDGQDKQWAPVEIVPVEPDYSAIPESPETKITLPPFNSSMYYKHLQTDFLGQSVLFARQMRSTQNIVDRLASVLPEDTGIVVVAEQQTSGKGRSGNVWESPLGCAMFSFPLVVALSSKLGNSLTLLQHMVATACVLAVKNTFGYEDTDLRIKWPNDILTSDKVKVGGVLVTSTIFQQKACCSIGVGFNVSNSKPTLCLNDLIRQHNSVKNSNLEDFTIEQFIARVLTELEGLVKGFQQSGAKTLLPVYLQHWLHQDQQVEIKMDTLSDKQSSSVLSGTIVGLDEYGFLQVKLPEGQIRSVQSDGNRFDMMANLLLVKH